MRREDLETSYREALTHERVCKMYGFPVRYHAKDLWSFKGSDAEVKQALDAVQSNKSVLIVGGCGSGKTHLAIALFYFWAKKFQPVTIEGQRIPGTDDYYEGAEAHADLGRYLSVSSFVTCADMFLELRGTFDNASAAESMVVGRYAKAHCLILDDLGVEKVSDWSRTILYSLLNYRYNELLPTIITSNFNLPWIAQNLDDRLASRLAEMGIVVDLGGKDNRLQ